MVNEYCVRMTKTVDQAARIAGWSELLLFVYAIILLLRGVSRQVFQEGSPIR